MAHPDDLLADHVDGTLPEHERAVVDAHLKTCERCREEVELARGAVEALRDLEDVPVPLGVTGRVLEEARSATPQRATRKDPSRWLAGLAAAAAIVAVIAVAVTRDDGSSGFDAAAESTGASGRSAAPFETGDVALEEQRDVNYDGVEGVHVLAREAIGAYRRANRTQAPESDSAVGGAEATPTEAAFVTTTSQELSGAVEKAEPGPAIRCLARAGLPPAGGGAEFTLERLIEARYSDTPAYFAVFLQGPGAGQPPDRAVVFVLSRKDCSVLNFADLPFDSEAAGTT